MMLAEWQRRGFFVGLGMVLSAVLPGMAMPSTP